MHASWKTVGKYTENRRQSFIFLRSALNQRVVVDDDSFYDILIENDLLLSERKMEKNDGLVEIGFVAIFSFARSVSHSTINNLGMMNNTNYYWVISKSGGRIPYQEVKRNIMTTIWRENHIRRCADDFIHDDHLWNHNQNIKSKDDAIDARLRLAKIAETESGIGCFCPEPGFCVEASIHDTACKHE